MFEDSSQVHESLFGLVERISQDLRECLVKLAAHKRVLLHLQPHRKELRKIFLPLLATQ